MSDKSVIFDEIIDASLDKMIEKDIIELEDSFYNCFHVELTSHRTTAVIARLHYRRDTLAI